MRIFRWTGILWAAAWLVAPDGFCQSNAREPRIGYAYPSGGQQGAEVIQLMGGQLLRGASVVYVSGTGVRGSVESYGPPLNNERLQALRTYVARVIAARKNKPGEAREGEGAVSMEESEAEIAALRDYPLVRKIERMSLPELEHWVAVFKERRLQPNAALAEMIEVRIVVDADAEPGGRELRLGTPAGYTNPLPFEVGTRAETLEHEPNHDSPSEEKALELPALINGQIMPGDVDRFRFHATKGLQLVARVEARHLMPFLADAVPGWFQAVLSLYDSAGRELACVDDYRFDPDPVLLCELPEDGEYTLEIRDALYRGREDFVYRIQMGELPFITSVFPLGSPAGKSGKGVIQGWNLPKHRIPFDTASDGLSIRQMRLLGSWGLSNAVTYAVDGLPEDKESSNNDTIAHAQGIQLPLIVNGRIESPGDVDWFRFEGRGGAWVAAEVYARRRNSPLDSLLRLTDDSGAVLQWNDDSTDKEPGLNTHAADSYVYAALPKDGTYYVRISDTQQHGGEEYAYRLRLSEARPDFSVCVTPSCINVEEGRASVFEAYAVRKDGFDGAIDIALADAPEGFSIDGGTVPPGQNHVRMTLTAPLDSAGQSLQLRPEGRATVNDMLVIHAAVPADAKVQAFASQHLVPAQEFFAAILKAKRRVQSIALTNPVPIRIPLNGTTHLEFSTPALKLTPDIQFELDNPPKGISLQEVTVTNGFIAMILEADGQQIQAGYRDNLIVNAVTERPAPANRPKAQAQRVPLGVLPAVPIEIAP